MNTQSQMSLEHASVANSQKGSSLLEVMIAGVLFMVGLLGLLATQGLSMKLSNSSVQYTNAGVLISDLYDRMRANPDGTDEGKYSTSAFNSASLANAPDCDKGTTVCTSTQLATYDLAIWKANLQSQFPSGVSALITRSGASTTQYAVQIIWLAQVENDSNLDGVEDAKGSNCAKGDNRPANERAVCTTLDVGTMEIF